MMRNSVNGVTGNGASFPTAARASATVAVETYRGLYIDRAMRSSFCAVLRARGLSKKTKLDPGAEAPALRHQEIERGRTSSEPARPAL
jgi:hypothetical protein